MKLRIRLFDLILLTLVLLVAVAVIAPMQLPVSLYKVSLISLAAVIGYWLDRSMFPYARPDGYLETPNWQTHRKAVGKVWNLADFKVVDGYHLVFAMAMLRRVIIVAAVVAGVALGM